MGGETPCASNHDGRDLGCVFFFSPASWLWFPCVRWNVTHHPPLFPSVRRGGAKYLRGPGFLGGLPSLWGSDLARSRPLPWIHERHLAHRNPPRTLWRGGGGTPETNLAEPGEAACVMVGSHQRKAPAPRWAVVDSQSGRARRLRSVSRAICLGWRYIYIYLCTKIAARRGVDPMARAVHVVIASVATVSITAVQPQ